MDRNQEALEDLLGTLRWALEIEWTDQQRAAIKPLCIQLAGDLSAGEPAIPPWRLRAESEKKRQALARVNELEARVAELDKALIGAKNGCFGAGWISTPRVSDSNNPVTALRPYSSLANDSHLALLDTPPQAGTLLY
jgi:hypothetical protein